MLVGYIVDNLYVVDLLMSCPSASLRVKFVDS